MEQTLCWNCANATGGCSWSNYDKRKPVKGWNAVKTEIKRDATHFLKSYLVIDCPEFVQDPPRNTSRKRGQY